MTPFRRLIERAANRAARKEIVKEATMTDAMMTNFTMDREAQVEAMLEETRKTAEVAKILSLVTLISSIVNLVSVVVFIVF